MRLLASACLSIFASIVIACQPAAAQQRDVAGSRDYPGIGRFGGSIITGYQTKDFDAARMQAAPFANGNAVKPLKLEGRVTRIAYRTGPGPSILEVSRNFENQLTGAGFEPLLACDTDQCGGIPFGEQIDVLPIPQMWIDGFNYRYFAAHKKSDSADIYASVVTSNNNNNITTQLVVAVVGAMENKMVDAAAMAKGLGEKGHIALYGIYFDTDKATLKKESAPTLAEMAKLLSGQPQMRVFIVGHTDSQGAYEHNMTLSRQRAEAVAAALSGSYRIARDRLYAAGVGYLAPVGSNATDEGRALNRRVELVVP
jgi:outer membrane protein OmpA-like peptidoglycan-associated protein